ncbi:MAG: LacI family transcriptional regulator [Lachnospiraceae bacterium]
MENKFLGIREIAQMANVSTATVSRVINHPEKCSEQTRIKVEKIIREHNYIPNETIKNIFSKSSNTIAIFIYDISNPFFTNLIIELNNICFKEHYTLLICDTENDIEKEKEYLKFCIAKRCIGIILTEGISNQLFKNIEIPLVSLDRKEGVNVPFVTSENYYIIRKIINYLYNLGHRNIAFVGAKHKFVSVEKRYQGYIDELKEKKLPLKTEYIYREGESLDTRLGKHALNYFLSLSEMPTALLCANDMVALGVINEARSMNINIPGTLSVCGFDHVLEEFLPVPLTTVKQNIPKIAEELFNSLTKQTNIPGEKIVESTFIPGQTCARAETGDRVF